MQPAPADSLIGYVLADKYRVMRQIGRGGMGVVYEAEHIQLGKRVAIKLMLEKYMSDPEAVARFHREAVAASRIGNPHIIDVSDVGTAPDGRSFVVMELLNGLPLTQVLEQTGPMVPWRAIAIIRQVLRAVHAAHAKGIIHRDLKPDNIFLITQGDQQDFVKLLDFGISKVVDRDEQVPFTKLTITGVVMGTPLYMAPEQAMGNPTDRYCDIYACGVILYQMLAGRPPFDGATYAVLVAKLLTSPPPPLESVRAGLPVSLVKAVHRALEKEPTARFATAELFAASLPGDRSPSQIELAGTLDSGLAVPAPLPTERRSGGRSVAIAALAFTLAAAGTAGVLLWQRMQASEGTVDSAAAKLPAAPDPKPETPAPAAAITGTLEVKSIPSGATVMVNDRPAGMTPIVVTLGAGRHKVKVELADHSTIETEEDVRAAERTSVVIPLQKQSSLSTKLSTKGRPKGRPDKTDRLDKSDKADKGKAKPAGVVIDPTEDEPEPRTLAKPAAPEPTKPPSDEPKKTGPNTKPNPY